MAEAEKNFGDWFTKKGFDPDEYESMEIAFLAGYSVATERAAGIAEEHSEQFLCITRAGSASIVCAREIAQAIRTQGDPK